ncbi:ABC transporter ATP-binding protein [Marinibaculum pumilum]|uniref:ABC transporter ATP-binding protein n=1 Tax=Marinibaculum pumilum TaxID=1766165 RepID=A0ABV7L599_9PROT
MSLAIEGLHAGYGQGHILQGVSFAVAPRQIAGIVGRNGSGRSTTLKAIVGLVPPQAGSVRLGDRELAGRKAHEIIRAGIAYVPEDRQVFENLTVEENLVLGRQDPGGDRVAWSAAQMYDYFPRLKERRNTRAGNLSGGEQQMLTICRSLLGAPKVILIDEPTEGLAPHIVARVVEVIEDIRRQGVAVVLVEQKLTIALKICDIIHVVGHGQVVHSGPPAEIRDNQEIRQRWLEVA